MNDQERISVTERKEIIQEDGVIIVSISRRPARSSNSKHGDVYILFILTYIHIHTHYNFQGAVAVCCRQKKT